MRVSVLVPSYQRPRSLEACLAALAEQRRRPCEVIVVTRADDEATRSLIAADREDGLEVREEVVAIPGQVGALIAGVEAAAGDVVAITDDDAAPRGDWIERLHAWFEQPTVVAAGGRDAIPRHDPGRGGLTVGRVRWFGKVVGNHHLGTGAARDVDTLKGVNMAFRREALARHGFDRRLLGSGAQVHNDLKLCLDLRRSGARIVYDPETVVDHFPAPRPEGDSRSRPIARHQIDAVHNETLALLEFLSPGRRVAFALWAVAIGRSSAPGIAHTGWTLARRREADAPARFAATMRGRWAGWRTYRSSRERQWT